jgi:hypothetical protein
MGDVMPVALSPRHTDQDFKDHWTIDDKVEVFIARIEGWQLGVALAMIEKHIPDRDVALLHIVTSYFEMISKYRSGFLGEGQSRRHFKLGLRFVFPGIEQEAQAMMDSLYSSLRNGLYHVGRPGPNVILRDGIRGSIGYNERHDLFMISPTQLVHDLLIHLSLFAAALRDPANVELRSRFERRFDADNKLPGAKLRAA